ncbi:MAG: HAD family hydrolase [Leptospiraceae bacterium]|nr:HAD family hydrolase [Leptospiraceae bacterium]
MKYIFLDRDGVINKRNLEGYILRWEDFEFEVGVISFLKEIKRRGYYPIIITNQQCIGKKILTKEALDEIHSKMNIYLKKYNAEFFDIFVCPHLEKDECECRKPKPGLLFQARDKHQIQLQNTFFIGDSITDIQAGNHANSKTILLNTNYNQNFRDLVRIDLICDSLLDILDFLD